MNPSNTPPIERPSIQDMIDRSMRLQMLEFGHVVWWGEPRKILKAMDNITRAIRSSNHA
jgi:hypothetical protein